MKKYNAFIVSLFFLIQSKAQTTDTIGVPILEGYHSYLKCIGDIEVVDSNYILIPSLHILDSSINIKIAKKIFYNPTEYNINLDCRLILQKKIRNNFATIVPNDLFVRGYDINPYDETDFSLKNNLTDTINLGYYFPFEFGDYRIRLKFNYKYNGNLEFVYSDWTYFEVNFLPKKSFFW